MQELAKAKVTTLTIIGLVMAVYLVVFAPYSIDKAQDVVIKKLSGLSGLLEKEGTLRLDAGKRLLVLSQKPDRADLAVEIKQVGTALQTAAVKEMKHPKLKGPGAILDKAAGAILKEAASLSTGEPVRVEFLKEKGGALTAAGRGMIKKGERLIKMVSL